MNSERLAGYTLDGTQGVAMSAFGDDLVFKATSVQTAGACNVFTATVNEGNGPPLHRHNREDELFYVLEGRVEFQVDGRRFVCGPESFAFAPRGSVHSFRGAGPGRSRMLVTTTPGGFDGFFGECSALWAESGGRPPEAAILEIFHRHGLELLGPPLSAQA
ncbi:MAG: cupin domain-containing protein [Phycisphaeraceae bacterium]|nr:cupin domain-containing protein [Phycisphaeraceae bacterium]